jgi:hypothetical protein
MSRRRAALLVLTLLGSACATTRPWQRAALARPEMALDGSDPEAAALRQHALSTREGAVGGHGQGGGGCGCN